MPVPQRVSFLVGWASCPPVKNLLRMVQDLSYIPYFYFSLGNDAIPTNSIAKPPPRIAIASKPTAKSNPDVLSTK
jgi:hypothetical protein